mmetsp:Transcript_17454/g.39409  ORF Transcript_17454/g.39409 Transcript_17454/m.39409 type:complete len:274 (-) Transcript_17454:285-1106(-)
MTDSDLATQSSKCSNCVARHDGIEYSIDDAANHEETSAGLPEIEPTSSVGTTATEITTTTSPNQPKLKNEIFSGKDTKDHKPTELKSKRVLRSTSPLVWVKFKLHIVVMFIIGFLFIAGALISAAVRDNNEKYPSSFPSYAPSSSNYPSYAPTPGPFSIGGVNEKPNENFVPSSAPAAPAAPAVPPSSNGNDDNLFPQDLIFKVMIGMGSILMLPLVLAGIALSKKIWEGDSEDYYSNDDETYDCEGLHVGALGSLDTDSSCKYGYAYTQSSS